MSVLEVQNFAAAAQNVAATTLRSVVGDMLLDDVLSKREEMNASLRMRLDDVTERWGVRVTTVEVREVNPFSKLQRSPLITIAVGDHKNPVERPSLRSFNEPDPRPRGRHWRH